MLRYIGFLILSIFIVGCATKQPIKSKSVIVVFKTPTLKLYDKGFITKYDDYTHLQVFNVGKIVLDIKIYKDEVCKSTFQCMSLKEFNKKYLSSSYQDNFLPNLLKKDKIYFKDKQNHILIKIRKEKG